MGCYYYLGGPTGESGFITVGNVGMPARMTCLLRWTLNVMMTLI